MSSQLWFNFTLENIQQFLISSITVDLKKINKISYSDILKLSDYNLDRRS